MSIQFFFAIYRIKIYIFDLAARDKFSNVYTIFVLKVGKYFVETTKFILD